jgi:hypothetical protein
MTNREMLEAINTRVQNATVRIIEHPQIIGKHICGAYFSYKGEIFENSEEGLAIDIPDLLTKCIKKMYDEVITNDLANIKQFLWDGSRARKSNDMRTVTLPESEFIFLINHLDAEAAKSFELADYNYASGLEQRAQSIRDKAERIRKIADWIRDPEL